MMIKGKLSSLFKENKQLLLFIVLMFTFRSSFADWYDVPTGSMKPTIVEGDRILVNKMAYRLDIPFTDIALLETGKPQRGDIVVFNSTAADNRLVKRVVGIPGDVVSLDNNQLIINGKRLDYSSTQTAMTETIDGNAHAMQLTPPRAERHSFAPVTVPEGHLLVLGDNRNHSADSRYYGFVPQTELLGRASRVLFSLNPEEYYLPRTERFFTAMR
ncbi:signal peptidase I [Alteromonas sp. H39]|uniref:signal peptidase I n=1 Tax=Alteromonas sp. H39 TaxID=3389876 RepID=UPI0039E11389